MEWTLKKFCLRTIRAIKIRSKVASLCRLIGYSRQAYYKAMKRYDTIVTEIDILIKKIYHLRNLHPYMGAKKLQYILSTYHGIKVGRDKLFALLKEHGLLVKRKRKFKYVHIAIAHPGLVISSKACLSLSLEK